MYPFMPEDTLTPKRVCVLAFIIVALLAFVALCPSSTDTAKVWMQYQGTMRDDGGWTVSILYTQDRETGTRCYIARGVEAISISCVKP